MDNLNELVTKIEKIIEEEKSKNPDIQHLNKSHAKLIAQIISNYNLDNNDTSTKQKQAQMIFLGAPTGAGKDTLVRKIVSDHPEKNFVILNMDMFRHYHNELSDTPEVISDKDYAKKTNQTSYELYYIIQEILLKEFPGTNVIVSGTIKDLDWVKEIVTRYKDDPNTDYSIYLSTLAVPTNESAFSIYERYLNMVSAKEDNETYPLRYTELSYHNDTIKDFIKNVSFFENDLDNNPDNSMFQTIRVYRRNKDMFDLSEDTLVYDSKTSENGRSAVDTLTKVMGSNVPIESSRISQLLNIVKENKEYLKSQELYDTILSDLKKIIPELETFKEYNELLSSSRPNTSYAESTDKDDDELEL